MRKILVVIIAVVVTSTLLWAQSTEIQFIFTSDLHFGISRPAFRGAKDVEAHIVDTALVAQINNLQTGTFPSDGGYRSA